MSLDDIVADTDDGLYLRSNRSWSIDDRRLNFQFATEVAYEIKGGKKGRLFKNPTYTGITYEFWRSCDAVGDASSYVMLGHARTAARASPARAATSATRSRAPASGTSRSASASGERGPRSVRAPDDRRPRRRRAAPGRRRARSRGARGRDRGRGAGHGRRAALTRFANSQIHQNVAETNAIVNLRFVVGKRVGVASSGRTDDEGLRRLAERAAAIARVVEELDDWGGLPGPIRRGGRRCRLQRGHRRVPSPESRADGVRARSSPRPTPPASRPTARSRPAPRPMAVANSHGVRPAGSRTVAQLLTVSMGPDGGTGYAESAAVDATTIDAAGHRPRGRRQGPRDRQRGRHRGRRLPRRPRGVRGRRPPRHARLPRVLAHWPSRRSARFVEVGKRIGSELVTIVDDGHDPAGLPMAFDYEGVAKQRVPLRRGRRVPRVVYDAQTAARDGVPRPATGCPPPTRTARSR